jgi:hypothetical protein
METPNKLSEENSLIADFMDLKKFGFKNKNYLVLGKHLSPIQLPYKTSWNWLMEIVDKIESLEDKNRCAKFNFKMEQSWIEIIDNRTSNEIVKIDANNKLLATYKAVVLFIEWYNKQ